MWFLLIVLSVYAFVISIKLLVVATKGECKARQSLNGKVAIVTGGRSGIGYETAMNLATRGCKVIIADVCNAENARRQIMHETKNKLVAYKFLDLSSFKSIREFVRDFKAVETRLDILVNNAECFGADDYTSDGWLAVMQVNYFGPVLLTHLLADVMKKTPQSTIVFVSSLLSFCHLINEASDIKNSIELYPHTVNAILQYANSKFCTLIASKMFARKLKAHGIICNAVHPGMIETELQPNMNYDMLAYETYIFIIYRFILQLFGKSAYEGAQTTLHCALLTKEITGQFFVDCIQILQPAAMKDRKLVNGIWKLTETIVQLKDNERL